MSQLAEATAMMSISSESPHKGAQAKSNPLGLLSPNTTVPGEIAKKLSSETAKQKQVPPTNPRIEEAIKYIREYKGPVQFKEDYDCRYCGSVSMGLLRKGLHPKERRAVATHAVSKIGKLGLKQHGMSLSITDKGMSGVHKKQGSAVFFEQADDIQYLLAGRKSSKTSTSTYVLIFARDPANDRKKTLVHLLRFSGRGDATRLYHAVHRMIRDNMFSNLFDIHSESEQAKFNPGLVQEHADSTASSIERHIAQSLVVAMEKIDSLMTGDEDMIEANMNSSITDRRPRRSAEAAESTGGENYPSGMLSPGYVDMVDSAAQSSTNESEYLDCNDLDC